jgi:phenylalanyl-tRNA synthetase beta chain
VLDIEFTPNLARCFSMIGVAREVAAILEKDMTYPSFDFLAEGDAIDGQFNIDIQAPDLNPRFTATLLKGTTIKPSPFWMQRRLKLIGQRPRNNIVDVTNYLTFELGQPLHAYDYDLLVERAGGNVPTIITRRPVSGETLLTLDDVEREFTGDEALVADTAGLIGLGGIMGGDETEINDNTTNVLLEAAAWDYISIRKTTKNQKLYTEASTRFSRGVHPSQAILGSQRGIELMRQLGGGQVAQGVIDVYPNVPETVTVDLQVSQISRLLGMEIPLEDAANMLKRLEFEVTVDGDTIHAVVPDHRMDISDDPVIGAADLVEEVARIYGYDKIPDTIMADEMPPQRENLNVIIEDRIRDILVSLGLYEVINYRFTHPDREALLVPQGAQSSLPDAGYVEIVNPSASDRNVLRHTLMINMLDNAINNARYNERQQIFEVGKVYLQGEQTLPDEPVHLGILITGTRDQSNWQGDGSHNAMDFYDLKGVIEALFHALHIPDYSYERSAHTSFHPGRSADLLIRGNVVGTFGEIHPKVAQTFKLTDTPILYAELQVAPLVRYYQRLHDVQPLPTTPAILEDIALIVDASIPNAEVEEVIRRAGGKLLKRVELFDVYDGDPIPAGKKSLAYALTYQDDEKTLTDKNATKIRKKIIGAATNRLNAELRS